MAALRALRLGLELEVSQSICNTHPLQPDYRAALSSTLQWKADRLLASVRSCFAELDSCSALRQAWSIAPDSVVWVGLLYSAARRAGGDLEAEAMRLLSLCPDLIGSGARSPRRAAHAVDQLGHWLLAGEPEGRAPVPDLGSETRLRPQWRLRFHLASAFERGETLSQLFRRAAGQPAASARCRQVEFLRVLEALRRRDGHVGRLAPTTIVLFDARETLLIRSTRSHWTAFVTPTLTRSRDPLASFEALMNRRAQIEGVLQKVEAALKLRAFDEVGGLLSDLPTDPIVGAVARRRFTLREFAESDEWTHPAIKPEWGPWRKLPPVWHKRIGLWRQRALPAVWAMSPAEVCRAILRKELSPVVTRRCFCIQDLIAIRRGWSESEQLDLIRAGSGSLLDPKSPVWNQLSVAELASALSETRPRDVALLGKRLEALPDARPWLSVMAQGDASALRARAERCLHPPGGELARRDAWSIFCASAVGTPEWYAVRADAIRAVSLLRQATLLADSGRVPVSPDAQRKAIAVALHEAAQHPRHTVALCLRWIAIDPPALAALVRWAPDSIIHKLIRSRSAPVGLRDQVAAISASISPGDRQAMGNT